MFTLQLIKTLKTDSRAVKTEKPVVKFLIFLSRNKSESWFFGRNVTYSSDKKTSPYYKREQPLPLLKILLQHSQSVTSKRESKNAKVSLFMPYTRWTPIVRRNEIDFKNLFQFKQLQQKFKENNLLSLDWKKSVLFGFGPHSVFLTV